MRPLPALALALLAAACAAPAPEGPSSDPTVIGEVGEPRNRARVHTELASLYVFETATARQEAACL